jgi:hypothetical protein
VEVGAGGRVGVPGVGPLALGPVVGSDIEVTSFGVIGSGGAR